MKKQGNHKIFIMLLALSLLNLGFYTAPQTALADEQKQEVVGNAGFVNPELAKRLENDTVVLFNGQTEGYVNNVRKPLNIDNKQCKVFMEEDILYAPLAFLEEAYGSQADLSGVAHPVIEQNGEKFLAIEDAADIFQKHLFQHESGLVILSAADPVFTLPEDQQLLQEVIDALSYTWNNVKISPEGFVTGLVFHPTEKDLMYCRTDVGGAYRWNANSQEWIPMMESFGVNETSLFGIDGIALSRTNPDVVYVAAGMYAYNYPEQPHDVLKSVDRGITWTRTNLNKRFFGNGANSYGDQRIDGERIAVDPYDENIVYCGTRYDGLWVTKDGAQTWEQVEAIPNGTAPVGVTNVEFDYSAGQIDGRAKTIYIGVEGVGVYRTTDGGGSWSLTSGSPKNPRRMALASDGTLYVSSINQLSRKNFIVNNPEMTKGTGVFKYTNGHWEDVTPRVGTPYGPVAVKPDDPNFVVAVEGMWSSGPIYISRNAGEDWEEWGKSRGVSSTFVFDPFRPDEIYDCHGAGIDKAVNFSKEKPQWIKVGTGIEELCAIDVCSLPNGNLLMGVLDRGGYFSTDKTEPAVKYTNPLTSETSSHDFCEQDINYVFRLSSSQTGSVARAAYSTDAGESWNPVENWEYGIAGGVALSATKQENGYPVVVAWTTNNTPKRSLDFGQTWEDTNGAPVYTGTIWNSRSYGIASDRLDGNTFYLYDFRAGQFYVSSDAGKNWFTTTSLPKVADTNDIAGVRAAPGMRGEVWVSNNKAGIYRSGDYGKTFKKLDNVQEAKFFAFGKNPPGKNHPAVFVYGEVNHVYGIFRSDDMGQTWVRINHDAYQIGDDPKCIAGDRRVYGKVYIGTGGRGFYQGQILGTDDVPPHLSVDQQSTSQQVDATYAVRSSEFPVTGSVNEAAVVKVNGKEIPVEGSGDFSTAVTLKEGDNRIVVSATDGSKNKAESVELNVRYDPDFVGITVDNLLTTTNQKEYHLSGFVNTPSTVTINGEVVAVDDQLRFEKTIALRQGENPIKIEAVDSNGVVAQAAEFVTIYDGVLPVIEIEQTNISTTDDFYIINGALNKDCTVTMNGTKQNLKKDKTFSSLVSLIEGTNTFTLEASDEAGNIAEPVTIKIQYQVDEDALNRVPQATAQYTDVPIVIDGKLDETEWSLDYMLTRPGLGNPNNMVHFGVLWDEEYLYVAAEVIDDAIVSHKSVVHQGDAFEIYLNPDNTRAGKYTQNDRQFICAIDWPNVSGSQNVEGANFQYQLTEEGYTMEFCVPWTNIAYTPKEGAVIGFDVDNIDNDGNYTNGEREAVTIWSGTMDNYSTTVKFGELTLSGMTQKAMKGES